MHPRFLTQRHNTQSAKTKSGRKETLKKDYIVRPYRQNDEEGIVRVLKLAFRGWPHFDIESSLTDHWKWKFKSNPSRLTIASVAVAADKVIGCTHRIPRRVKIGKRIVLGDSGADAATHPEFRGSGVFTGTEKLAVELEKKHGIELTYAFSSSPTIAHAYKSGIFPHKLVELVRIRDINLHMEKRRTNNILMIKFGFFIVKAYNRLKNALTSNASSESVDFCIQSINSFDDSANRFWDEIKNSYTFIVERTKDYLNWRYCDPRGGAYLVKIAEQKGRVLGYIVLRINKYHKDYRIAYIVDLLTLPDRLAVANALVRDALRVFDDEGINIVKCQIIESHPYKRLLERYGFLNSRERVNAFLRPHIPLQGELRELQESSADRVHLVYGDYDDI